MVDILEKMFDNSQSSKEKVGTLSVQKFCLNIEKSKSSAWEGKQHSCAENKG